MFKSSSFIKYSIVAFNIILAFSTSAQPWEPGENLVTSALNTEQYTLSSGMDGRWKVSTWIHNKVKSKDTLTITFIPESKANINNFKEVQDRPLQRACANFSTTTINTSPVKNYPSLLWETRCRLNGFDISTIQILISGNDQLFHIKKQWLTKVDSTIYNNWKSQLQNVSVCDTRINNSCPASN